MNLDVKGSRLESLFLEIRRLHTESGYDLFTPWDSWPTLNEYYPAPSSLTDGDYFIMDEGDRFLKYTSPAGSHPVLGSHIQGNHKATFESLKVRFGLELALDLDAHNIMTYQGHRNRYWKVTKF